MKLRRLAMALSLAACAQAAPGAYAPAPPAAPPPAPPMAPSMVAAPAPPPPPPPPAEEPLSVDEPPPLPKVGSCSRSAVVLVIDRSGSMSGLPMEMAKEGAALAVTQLADHDCYGLITFDTEPTRLIPLAPVKDRWALKSRIARVTPSGGTDLRGALQAAAREVLSADRAARRGVVLMTDGQSLTAGLRDLAQLLARENVTLSTVGLGGGIDEATLRMLAAEGNGRMSKVSDPKLLPSVLAAEVTRIVAP